MWSAALPPQTIYLGPGDHRELVFDNLKQPELTIAKGHVDDGQDPGYRVPIIRSTTITAAMLRTGKDGTVTFWRTSGSL